MRKVRGLILGIAVAAVTLSGSLATAGPDDPGYCKKQGPSGCSGESECGGPHALLLPPGQENKC
jgi:hypothetical protein